MAMKKIVSLLLVVVSLVSLVSVACASGKTLYDADKVQLVVVSFDTEKNAPYTGVYALKTVAKLAAENNLCECYGFENDGLVPLEWTVGEAGTVVFTSKLTGETYAVYVGKTAAKKAK